MDSAYTYTWDKTKAAANLANHGVAFSAITGFDWTTALIADDTRFDYTERRQIALGLIGTRLHVCVFTDRDTTRRIISLRKANRREIRKFIGD